MSSLSPVKKPPRRLQLRFLVVLVFLALALAPIVVLTVLSTLNSIQTERASVTAQLEILGDLYQEALEREVALKGSVLTSFLSHRVSGPAARLLLTGSETGQGAAAYAAAREQFGSFAYSLLEGNPAIGYLLLVDASGVVRASSDDLLLGQNMLSETWLQQSLTLPDRAVYVGGPAFDSRLGYTSLYYVTPVIDDGGQTVGALMMAVGVDTLVDIMGTLPVAGITGDVYLVRTGQRYAVPPRLDRYAVLAEDEIVPLALTGRSGSGSWTDYRGQQVFGVYRWIEPLGMSLVLKQDTAESLGDIQRLVRMNILFAGLLALVVVGFAAFVTQLVLRSITTLRDTAIQVSSGEWDMQVPGFPVLELDQLALAFNRMTGQLRDLVLTQEQTIEARTRDVLITAQMGRLIAAETDLERLLNLTVDLLRDRLGYYHAQVFLIDDLRQYAVLRSSTGDVGRQLLERGHKLPVGSSSVIGQVTARGEPVLASDTRHAIYWVPNPLLPDTRAELAVPLRVGDQIIGALDIQATEPDAFDEPTIATLQTVADQLSVAIRNAQLFQEKENLLSASLELTQMLTRENWESYVAERLRQSQVLGFEYDLSGVRPVRDPDDVGNGRGLALPIELRGQVIGDLIADLPEGAELTDEQQQVIARVLERVALALENARLFEQTQLSLMETNRLYEASQRISEADSVAGLVGDLMEMVALDPVDRAFLFMLDNPDDEPGEGRWVQVIGSWERSPGPAALPRHLNTARPPLLGIEDVSLDGVVIDRLAESTLLPEAARQHLLEAGTASLATFPLVAGRRVIAWLQVQSTRPAAFSDSDIRYLQALTDQAATALESLRLLEQTQMRARRLQYANEVSRAASSILNLDILLPLVVDQISQAFGFYHAQIFLVDDMGQYAVLRASTGEVGQELLRRGHRLAVGSQSVIGQVTARGEPVIARDTDTDAVHRRNELLPNTRAEMAIPLRTGDRIIGALDVQSTEPNAFDVEVQAILQSLADQLSVTLENAQLFQEIQERVAELTTVNLVSQSVSRAQTLDDLYDVVTVQLIRTFGAQHAFLGILTDEKQEIQLPILVEAGRRVASPPPMPLGEGISSYVIRTKQVLLLNENVEQEASKLGARIAGASPKSILAVPLLIGDEVIGVISIQDRERENAYDESHVRQLSTLAAYIAVKIRNAELLEEAQRRAAELGFLFNMTRAAVTTTDIDRALTNVVDIIQRELSGAESVVVYLADLPELLVPHAAVGYGREAVAGQQVVAWGEGLVGQVAQSGQALVIADAHEPPYEIDGGARTRSALLVPLATRGETVGVLAVESTRTGVFGERELQLLQAASGTLTAIVQNARLLDAINQAYEELQELDKLKSQFLANMSHELRTPLNSIIGFSRVILKGIDGELTDLQRQDLTTIYNSGTHLLRLINEILDMSKIEAGKMEIQPEFIDLTEIIAETMRTAEGLVQDKPIELIVEVPDDLPQIYGDPVRVRQVLLNLVSNAAKFTYEGHIRVRAVYHEFDSMIELPCVQVDVEDTGIGIAPEDMGKLFEAFRQVDGSPTRQAGGTGLGLPIAREFVEMHGGRMWVDSEVGVGSTFSFTIPTVLPSQPQQETAAEEEGANDTREMPAVPPLAPPPDRPVILAVDDEPGVLDLYARFLEREGYAVARLEDANDLLAQVRQIKPAAIVLDLFLPGKSGWDAVAELRAATDTCNIPVIVSTIAEEEDHPLDLEVAAYLVKPVTEEDLIEALDRVMSTPLRPVMVRKVLVIDGDREYGAELADRLAQAGDYTVHTAGTGYEGLHQISEFQPDLVVMDVDLPDMDGWGLLTSMRTQETMRDLPVLLVTARDLAGSLLRRVSVGQESYFNKGAQDFETLVARLTARIDVLRGRK
ncbi:MAG: hypothetical protein Kow00124_17510 [Anaerolineae bacterium]